MRLARFGTLRADQRGLAAVEFALIAGPLMIFTMMTFEIVLRMQAVDSFDRYAYQIGDVLSRDDGLTAGDLDVIYNSADLIMQDVDVSADMLDIDVASIGFQNDGEPVLLWRRYRGNEPGDIDLEEAVGLAGAGETVLRVNAKFRYSTPIKFLSGSGTDIARTSFFKPRTTRAISMDDKILDAGVTWDFYSTGS